MGREACQPRRGWAPKPAESLIRFQGHVAQIQAAQPQIGHTELSQCVWGLQHNARQVNAEVGTVLFSDTP